MSAIVNLFYIYDPWFFHFFRMAFFVGLISGVYLLYQRYQKKNNGIVIPKAPFLAIIGLIGISFLPLLIHGTTDFSVVIMYVKALILFAFGVAIYQLFYMQQNGQSQLIRDLQIGVVIQSLVGFLALCGIGFFVELSLSSNAYLPRFFGSEQEYRLYNITSSAFFQLSIFYLFLLHFLLAYNYKHNNLNSWLLFLLLFIGTISGRSFLMLSVISIALYFKWRYVPPLMAFAAVVLFLAKFYPEHRYVEHALEPVINLLNGADRVSSSTDNLVKNHLFMPSIKQILIGDGLYMTGENKYYGGSDSGFIRQSLYGGIIYLLACLSFTAFFVRKVAINWFNGSWKFILSTLFIFSVLHIKADTYAFPGIMLVLLMFLALFEPANSKHFVLFKREQNES